MAVALQAGVQIAYGALHTQHVGIDVTADSTRLFHLEDMLVEVLLKLLIGQVDAELLKVILLEALKAINI